MEFVASAGLIPCSARSLPRLKLYQPATVAEALAALADAEAPVLLAGGTDLVAQFNEGLRPSELIDLSRVTELGQVQADDSVLRIGACVTHGAGSAHAAVIARASGFAQAWARISKPRVRFTATIGGNLMARRARYEASVLLSAAKARLEFATVAGPLLLTPGELWAGLAPQRSLLKAIEFDTQDLLGYFYERAMRPLLTLAVGLRRSPNGLLLSCAVATEHLQPALLELALPGADLARVARDAKAIAQQLFAQLPMAFADPVITHPYAKTAGAVLLARRLGGFAHG
jgi:aerobic carbon-monoxide dehydrogenase medium subunit